MATILFGDVAIVDRAHRTALVTSDASTERFARLVQSVNGENIKVDILGTAPVDVVNDVEAIVSAARDAGYEQLLVAVQL